MRALYIKRGFQVGCPAPLRLPTQAMTTSSASLAAQLPSTRPPSPDDILNGFLGYVARAGLSLYPAQEEAILELVADKHVVLNTPTGSGKSLVATALHFKAMAEGKVSFYTCPIKA